MASSLPRATRRLRGDMRRKLAQKRNLRNRGEVMIPRATFAPAAQVLSSFADGSTSSSVGLAVAYAAGLATSFTPCTLSMLPLTIGYIASEGDGPSVTRECSACREREDASMEAPGPSGEGPSVGRANIALLCSSFSLGICTTYTSAGVASALMGSQGASVTFGNAFGPVLPLVASLVAIAMGLNILGVVELNFPSLFSDVDPRRFGLPTWARAYLTGLLFASTASPCATPVLAAILAYVASISEQQEILGDAVGTFDVALRGGLPLLCYSAGYVSPLMLASLATSTFTNRMLAMRERAGWVTTASGVVLLTGGVYTLSDRLMMYS